MEKNPNERLLNRRRNTGNPSSTLAGFLLGGILGAGAMLLLAPQSGQKTREELQKGAVAVRDRTVGSVKDAAAQARSKAEEFTGEARAKADELKQRGKEIAVEQLDRVSEAAETGKKAIKGS